MQCAVSECPNSTNPSNNDLRVYEFPRNWELKEQWLYFCGRNAVNTKTDHICEEHFTIDDFELASSNMSKNPVRKLKPNAVPSVYQYAALEEEFEMLEQEDAKLDEIKTVAQRKQIVTALLADYDEEQLRNESSDDGEVLEEHVRVVVDADAYLKALESENAELKRQNFKMKLAEQDSAKSMEKLQKKFNSLEEQNQQLITHLQTIFSKAQIDRLRHGKRIVWPEDDLIDACAIYATSSKVYNMLLSKNYPLPSIRTLQNWDCRQREHLVQKNDKHADCTIHHWRCYHRAAKSERRKEMRQQALQNQREEQATEKLVQEELVVEEQAAEDLVIEELVSEDVFPEDQTIIIPNLDHNYVHF